MTTIGDVAQFAGVSRSTVSYALSGKRAISRETRERIESAINELGYTPNAGARALATSQTMVIGLFVQFFRDEFSPAMLQYVLPISDAAREWGYDILMVTEEDGPRALQRITDSEMVDGVVLLNVGHEDSRVAPLRAARQPGALVGLPRDTEGLDVFDLDFGEAARMLVDHLYALGHREIILISPHQHVIARGGAYVWRFREAALERGARYGLRIFPYFGETEQPHIASALQRHSRRASHGDRADHPQRRDDRRASSGPERSGSAGAGRHLGRRHLFRRLRTTVLAAVHGN